MTHPDADAVLDISDGFEDFTPADEIQVSPS